MQILRQFDSKADVESHRIKLELLNLILIKFSFTEVFNETELDGNLEPQVQGTLHLQDDAVELGDD